MMTKIRSCNNSFDADQAKGILDAENIPVMIKSGGHFNTYGGNMMMNTMGGVDLYVPEEEAEKASGLLEAYYGKA